MDELTAQRRARYRLWAVSLGLVVVGLAGYVGFVRFDGPGAGGVLFLAAATGFAAFFSPCSFPLLLTLLSRRSSESPAAALASSTRVALGGLILLTLIATVIGFGGSALAMVLGLDTRAGQVFRLTIAVVLVALGLRQSRLWGFRMRWLDRVAATSARMLDPSRVAGERGRDVVYGFGYLLAGFG